MNKKADLLHYTVSGEGKPVVFIHGFLEDNQMWNNLLPYFGQIKAIYIELPGHGKSNLLQRELTLDSIAEAFKNTIQHIGLSKFIVVGHSMGGYVALHLTEIMENKIEKLVLFHSHPWADSSDKKTNRTRAAKLVKSRKSLFVREAITELYAPQNRERLHNEIEYAIKIAKQISSEAIAQSLIAMRDREDKVSVLEKLHDNAFIIHGEFDPLVDKQKMQETALKNGNHFYSINGIGHIGYNEAPEKVAKILLPIVI